MKQHMKQLILASLLALGAVATAQAETGGADTQREAESAKSRAQRDAEDLKLRAQLDKARAELDRKAQEVAELSMKLGGGNDVLLRAVGPRQAMLGVQIDPESGTKGARVLGVSPGGPADEAGLKTGDVVVMLDGKSISGKQDSGRALVDEMRAVKPDQKVKVRVLRAGKNKDLVVVARPMEGRFPGDRMLGFRGPEAGRTTMGGVPMGGGAMGSMPMFQQFRTFTRNEFNGLELARVTPKLGAYFGATDGVLVVSAPENDSLKLEDGDVIQGIDGRTPTDGAHALRILRSYKSGEKLNLTVLRQRKPVTLAVTMPARGDMEDEMFMTAPMSVPMPGPMPGPMGGPMQESLPLPPPPGA
jgi:hypothetical protein